MRAARNAQAGSAASEVCDTVCDCSHWMTCSRHLCTIEVDLLLLQGRNTRDTQRWTRTDEEGQELEDPLAALLLRVRAGWGRDDLLAEELADDEQHRQRQVRGGGRPADRRGAVLEGHQPREAAALDASDLGIQRGSK